MHRLVSPDFTQHDLPNGTVTNLQKARMMVGTSPGRYGKHDPAALPLDAVTYMLRADVARHTLDADGAFLALDKRHDVASDKKDAQAIKQRTDRLRELVQRLTGLRFVTEDNFDPVALERSYEEQDLMLFEGTPSPRYWQRQTVVVLHSLGVPDGKQSNVPLYKFGAVETMEGGKPVGGEATFDEHLPTGLVKPIYTPPAYMRTGESAIAYLHDSKTKADRVLLPMRESHIDRELQKLDAGVARIAYETWMATCQVILQEEEMRILAEERLTYMPLDAQDKELVTDTSQLDALRDKLRAALTTLCS